MNRPFTPGLSILWVTLAAQRLSHPTANLRTIADSNIMTDLVVVSSFCVGGLTLSPYAIRLRLRLM
jgi:hypothetical protein